MDAHFSILPADIIQCLVQTLRPAADNPPKSSSSEPRMLRLPHPRTGHPSLFLPTEWLSMSENNPSILEIQAVSPPDERSWITGEEVVADGKLLIMTPVDPSFLLIPIMRTTEPLDASKPQFKPADDLFDEAAKRLETPHGADKISFNVQDILDFCSLSCTRKCLTRVCEKKEITNDLTVYRYSQGKVTEYMRAKVARLSKSQAFEGSQTLIRKHAKEGLMEDGKEELLILGRMRSACDLISQYLPITLSDVLINSYDFARLQTLLDSNKEEAIANAVKSATANQNKAQKATSGTADKKRKASKSSVAVEKLKKANTTGMAKLSNFFNKV